MLSRETEQKVRRHFTLAEGLIRTTAVDIESSEFEERNALSRAYYAMFHACSAWLAAKYGITKRLKHYQLLDEMHRGRGKRFGDFVRDVRGLRRAADYREDWKPQSLVVQDRIEKVKQEVSKLRQETEAMLSGSEVNDFD